uniref:G-patch domain-containing protein n=1 Tax=Caenorhabditis japonica TaxID=281687 RepID=A0A8R1DIP2_CAEJA
MNESSSWRGPPQHAESWRSMNSDIPLPPSERQTLPSLMDPPEVVELRTQIDTLRQKIVDSEQNLNAHKQGMDELLMVHLKSAIRSAETLKIERLLSSNNLHVDDLETILDALSTSKCSKEYIAQAKRWIFDHCTNDQLREIILTYLLNKVKDEASAEYLRLHILYLINDWAFHCQRKKEDNQMKMLARYVPKMFAYCIELASSSEISVKLEGKLLGEWEGRGYFSDQVFKQLRNTIQIVSSDREIERSSYATVRESIRANLMATFDAYEQQHITYSQHILGQIEGIERQINEFRNGPSLQPRHQMATPSNMRRSRFDQAPSDRSFAPRQGASSEQTWRASPGDDIDGTPFDEDVLKPKKSYLALPAGIMTPLIPITSFKYEPIDPDALEMPPVVPPSQRLLNAKNAFRQGVEMDIIAVDGAINDGTDLLKCPAEFLDKKAEFKKDFLKKQFKSLEEMIKNKPSAADKEMFQKERKIKEDELIAEIKRSVDDYYGPEETPFAEEESPRRRSVSKSRSRSPERRRSPSRSPRRRRSSSPSSSSSSSSSSRSSSNSSSSSGRRRSPDRSKYGGDRPSFGYRPTNEPLSSDNKGAQLMAKMGWTSGKGLGSNESGIVDPVSGGEVRDRNEQFMGFGKTLDPYEQFRKQRSGNYHERGSFHRK